MIRVLWFRWLLANLSAFTLSYALFGTIDYLVDLAGAHGFTSLGIFAHIAALIFGAVIVGSFQSRIIRQHVPALRGWGIATALAYTFAYLIGESLGGLTLGLLLNFTIFGAASGVLQGYLLLRHGLPGLIWALVSCVGFATGGVAASAIILYFLSLTDILGIASRIITLALIGGIAGGIGAAISGLVLSRVLKPPVKN